VILFAFGERRRVMRPRERRETGQTDLFKARLDQIVDMNHALAKLAAAIDWGFLEKSFGTVYNDGPGQPPLPTRLMAGLAILKHMHNLSDEVLCERFIENPYYQLFCGEEFFQHKLPFDRSSMARWRQRMGEEKLIALLQESLATATKVIIDTTVQPKAVVFPTDARLMQRALDRLARLAKRHGIRLRQSYARVGKCALIKQSRYAHAKQFKRARRALKTLKTYLGRVIRDITRKIAGNESLREVFAKELMLARRVHAESKNLRPVKGMPAEADLRVFSLHAPEVECIGKGKAVRRQSFLGDDARPCERRAVHRSRQSLARQAL
jgi:transposase, IS5 family